MIDTTRRVMMTGALAAAGVAATGPARATPASQLDTDVERARTMFEVPGLSVTVVEDDRTVLAKGYGVQRLGGGRPVDAATLFPIGSNTKAFTGAAVALLVEEGKLAWEDKVVDRLPGFRMYDDYTTREMTVVDLLVHRSGLGLGAGDLMFWPRTDFTRPEIVERLRYIRPATSFRSGFAYDNVLYLVAGELIAAVSGRPYEAFVAERLLGPLGMTAAIPTGSWTSAAVRTSVHARTGGAVRGLGPIRPLQNADLGDAVSPSGGIWSSATDIARWLSTQARTGVTPDGRRLWSEASARRMWRGETVMRASPFAGEDETQRFVLYGLGWQLEEYQGEAYVWHLGGVQGALSLTAVIPSRKVGFAILTNAEESGALRSLRNQILDHYLGRPRRDWLPVIKAQEDEGRRQMAAQAAEVAAIARPAKAAAPSLPLPAYVGVWRDPWYGDVVVGRKGEGLTIDFTRTPALKGALEPWDGDTFRTRFKDPAAEDAFVTFTVTDGVPTKAALKAVSPMADFSFDYADLALTPAG